MGAAELMLRIYFWGFAALIAACLEVEIEGKRAWGYGLPTWFRVEGTFGGLCWRLQNGKPISGYHLFRFLFYFGCFCHAPFIMGQPWSSEAELLTVARFLAWDVMRSYLFYMLNPAFSKRFGPDGGIWCYEGSSWSYGFPAEFFYKVVASLALAALATAIDEQWLFMRNHGIMLFGWAGFCFIVRMLSPWYQRWHFRMHRTDQRVLLKVDRDDGGNVVPIFRRK